MHRAWPLLLLVLGAAGSVVAQSESAPGRRMSERLAREIRSTLPAFDPALERPEQPGRLADRPADPGVIEMPEVVVRDVRIRRVDPDSWLSRGELQAKMKRQYLAKMSPLETLLGAWSIPLLLPSVQARANVAYDAEKMRGELESLDAIAGAAASADPAAGASLKKEIHTLQHGSHPPGWPPIGR